MSYSVGQRLLASQLDAPTPTGPITIGGDVNLYRGAADLLKTDDGFVALGVGGEVFGYCTADATVNNSTTLVNVTGLSVSLQANAKYVMSGALGYTSGATPDVKFAFSVTGGPTGWWALMPVAITSAGTIGDIVAFRDTSFTAAQSAGGSDTLNGNACALPHGYVVTTSAATMQLQFAQLTANASNTVAREGSFLRLLRVA